MPNIKSAKKRVKVIEVKTARNKAFNSSLKTSLKKANAAITDAAADKADVVKAAIVKIDKAVSKGILHKNTAARKKSALAVQLNKTNA
ncbi:MAG: 30S ribosomal protein S20 [Clostridiales bacterium 43-6]|nr:MAG: 30S ribosomal protein S20 [Clostridiales bacterium 43-6]